MMPVINAAPKFTHLSAIRLYTSPAPANGTPEKSFAFNDLHSGLVSFTKFAFTLGISTGTLPR